MNNVHITPYWLKPAAVAVLLGTIGLIALILMLVLLGIANPKPLGMLVVDSDQPLQLVVSPADHTIYQPAHDAVHCPCTIEMTMRQTGGASVEQYGLWWRADNLRGDDAPTTIAALNGNGYYAIFDDTTTYLSEWQRFPWLLPHGESNRLRLDLAADGSALLRLNDEIAAAFRWSAISPIEIGYYMEAADGASTVIVDRLRVWSSD